MATTTSKSLTVVLFSLLLPLRFVTYNNFVKLMRKRYVTKRLRASFISVMGILMLSMNFIRMDYKAERYVSSINSKLHIHSFLCRSEEYKHEWSGHILDQGVNDSNIDIYTPTKEEEPSNRLAPTIPNGFIIEEQDFCSRRPNLKAIVYVSTAMTNVQRRAFVRNNFDAAPDEISVVFIVGRARNKMEEGMILTESQSHHDIIQGNFTEGYTYLLYKTLNALYWLKKNCQNVKWVMHADDDVIVDYVKYMHYIKTHKINELTNRIFCSFSCAVKVARQGKYAVSRAEYPFNHFPIFCGGNLWFTSMDAIVLMLRYVPQVKFLVLEDVYVTGFLAEMAKVKRHFFNIMDEFSFGTIA